MEKNNRVYMIIIFILLFVVGLCIGYIMGTSVKENELKNNSKERIEEKIEEKKPENATDKAKSKEQINGVLQSNGDRKEIEISLNGSTNTLVLEKNEGKDSIFTFGNTKLCFLTGWGTGPSYDCAPEEAEYTIIKGKDSKEYLVLYYQSSFDKYLLILNDKTEIIGKFSSKKEFKFYDCFAVLDDMEKAIYYIENDEVYYYKSNQEIEETNKPIELELMKLEISNDKVEEISTNKKVTGKYSQCT